MPVCLDCPALVPRGKSRCPQHERRITQQVDRRRGTRTQRGYDNNWIGFSKARLARQPWCVGFPKGCHGMAKVLAQCTDHEIPLRERPDLKYEESNLNSLCLACNTRKAVTQDVHRGEASTS